jgi:large repetitive protein
MKRKITLLRLVMLSLFLLVLQPLAYAQVYQHNFGTGTISTHPYTVAPAVLNTSLSGSSWSNSTGAWINYGGASGQALSLSNSSGTPTITLSFTVAAGKQLDITSFSFWRQRSNTGAQAWTLSINGIPVGAGLVPTGGTNTGDTPVALPVTGLTGTVNVVLSLTGATGNGTFRLDDFTLNGTVTSACTEPVITSIYPTSGPANTLVTITGSGFEAGSGTSAVNFNGVASTGFTVVSDTQIKAIVPFSGTTGPVTITTNSCTGTGSAFTVLQSDCPASTGPTDLFISEVYDADEGEGGAVEIYNGTGATVNLAQYSLTRFADGSQSWTVTLSGTLATGQTYIARTNTPVCGLTGTPATTLQTGFNENDGFELKKNGAVIDKVEFPDDTGYTFIRTPDAAVPSAVYNPAQWSISLTENCANLGVHTINTSVANQITAQPLSAAICEGASVTYTVTLSDAAGITYQWRMLNASGTWVNVTNSDVFSGATTASLTINDAPLDLNTAQFYCQVVTATSCNLVSNAVQLTVSPLPVAIISPVHPTCITPTGSIVIVPSIGDGLTYSLNGTTYQAAPLYTGLTSGNYTLYVQSSAGCITQIPFVINTVPTLPAVADVTVTQPECGQLTGAITINSPVELGLTYSINGTDFQTEPVFSGLAPGTYTVSVMTVLGCTSITANVTINEAPDAPAVAAVTPTQPTCTTPGGIITVTAPLGNEYTYSINGTDFQDSPVFSGLTPGSYNITVQNGGGCTSVTPTETVINAAPAAPAVAAFEPLQPTCNLPAGTLTVTAPIGTAYSYSINGGTTWQESPVFAGLEPGTYTITTQNEAGCTSVTAAITINTVPAPPATAVVAPTHPTCPVPSGTLTITAPLGDEYTYSIDGGTTWQENPVFTGLTPGQYTVTTQNTAGCTSVGTAITINIVPTPPPAPVAIATQPNCTTITKGSITVQSPLNPGYTYSIDGTTWQEGTIFADLDGGTYTVSVQNASGCISTTTVTINQGGNPPAVPETTVTPLTCTVNTGTITVDAPVGTEFTYSIDGGNTWQPNPVFAGLEPNAYQITVMNEGGCTATTPQITIAPSPVPEQATAVPTHPTCFDAQGSIAISAPTGSGYSYSIDGTTFQNGTTFINLEPGTYTVTVQNLSGCTSVAQVVINNTPVVPAPATASVTQQPTCNTQGGTITITAPVGDEYTYSIDGTNYQAGTAFTGLEPGSYTITVMSTGGCTSQSAPLQVNQPTGTLLVVATQGCEETPMGNHYLLHVMPDGDSFDAEAATYAWMDEDGNVVGTDSFFDATEYALANQVNPAEFPLGFMVVVTTPGGCTGTATYAVYGTYCDIPKGISPNNDGYNDNFDISGMNASKVSIFNRFGQEVYTKANYTDEWYGQSNSGDVPSGTYYYVIELPEGTRTGWVYVNRESE